MHSKLIEIIAEKEREVRELKKKTNPFPQFPGLPLRRDFKKAIGQSGKINLIAEIKFASPSAGIIREKMDPIKIGRTYEEAGAAAISFLTDQKFFGGDLKLLPFFKKAVALPVLRKDFIIDEIQIKESFHGGADAILLIARILTEDRLRNFLDLSRQLGMAALVEVHDREDLEKAKVCGAEMIGINNRDLSTFEVNLQTTLDLASLIPKGCVRVSESGITHKEDIRLLAEKGIQAVLVGTSLMKSDNLLEKTRELIEAGRR